MENWNSTNTNVRFIFVKRLEGGLEKPEEEELSSRRNMSRRKDPKKQIHASAYLSSGYPTLVVTNLCHEKKNAVKKQAVS